MLAGTKLLTFHGCVVPEQTALPINLMIIIKYEQTRKSSGRLHHVDWYIATNIVECSAPKDICNYLPFSSAMRMPDLICSQYLANTSTIKIPQIPLILFSHLKALKRVWIHFQ
jgi:hypothetical protein